MLLDRATTALTFTSLIDGATGTLFVTQDATGGRALTVQAGSVGFTQDAPALAANAVTRYRWIRQGTNLFWEALTYGTVTPGPAHAGGKHEYPLYDDRQLSAVGGRGGGQRGDMAPARPPSYPTRFTRHAQPD